MKYILFGIVLCMIGLFALSRFSNRVPSGLGGNNGRLAQCPSTDNCVSSQAEGEAKRIEPIKAHGPTSEVMTALVQAIDVMKGGRVAHLDGQYLRAEFSSPIWGFIDDVECYYDEENGNIDIRSASRVGYSDFGANRRRVETLRKILTTK